MKINIRQIRRNGLTIDKIITPQSIDLDPQDVGLKTDLHVKAFFEKIDQYILVKASVEATYGYTCGRCLEEMEATVTDQFEWDFELTPELEVIDVGEEIRQELIMDHTPWMLCNTDENGKCIRGKPLEAMTIKEIIERKIETKEEQA